MVNSTMNSLTYIKDIQFMWKTVRFMLHHIFSLADFQMFAGICKNNRNIHTQILFIKAIHQPATLLTVLDINVR